VRSSTAARGVIRANTASPKLDRLPGEREGVGREPVDDRAHVLGPAARAAIRLDLLAGRRHAPRVAPPSSIQRGASPEFELVAEDTDVPSVIVGALSPYVVRLEGEASRGTLDAGGRTSLDAVYETFERMASSRDGHVENALVVEVFEHLHCTERIRRRIVKQLGPHSRAVYDRWVA
jgi:hypothetical protein